MKGTHGLLLGLGLLLPHLAAGESRLQVVPNEFLQTYRPTYSGYIFDPVVPGKSFSEW